MEEALAARDWPIGADDPPVSFAGEAALGLATKEDRRRLKTLVECHVAVSGMSG